MPLLADRGVVMTSTQVYRIVTGEPSGSTCALLAALCDIFGCTPNDLIEPYVVATSSRGRKAAAAAGPARNPASKTGRAEPPSPAPTTPDRVRCRRRQPSPAPSAAGHAAAERPGC